MIKRKERDASLKWISAISSLSTESIEPANFTPEQPSQGIMYHMVGAND